jgi:hypothetical protein
MPQGSYALVVATGLLIWCCHVGFATGFHVDFATGFHVDFATEVISLSGCLSGCPFQWVSQWVPIFELMRLKRLLMSLQRHMGLLHACV